MNGVNASNHVSTIPLSYNSITRTVVSNLASSYWIGATRALIRWQLIVCSVKKMNENEERTRLPSGLRIDDGTLNFLTLLCEELGDKEAITRAYRRWEVQEHVRACNRSDGRSFASEMARKAREIEESRRNGLAES